LELQKADLSKKGGIMTKVSELAQKVKRISKQKFLMAVALGIMMICLAACGKRVAEYTVTFDLNGGSLVNGELQQKVTEGLSAVAPDAKNGNDTLSWDRDFTTVMSDIVVKAVWEPETFEVEFDLNGGTLVSGSLTQEVAEGDSAVAPQAENGFNSLTWDTDFSSIDSDTKVTAIWEKVELTSVQVAEIVQKATVSISCTYTNGNSGSGSGFLISDDGQIVTSYHVIEYANSIEVEIPETGKSSVSKVIAFDERTDLAILKIDKTDTPFLVISEDAPKVGESVYANGSALGFLDGTFTSGTVSSVTRDVNGTSCIQMDAAISNGNSGGPLVNSYAEVIGVNALSYDSGENLNFAVKIDNLETLSQQTNFTVKDYEEWIMKETDRSFAPHDTEGNFYYSTINTYTHVTGSECLASADNSDEWYDGYVEDCLNYYYDYNSTEVDEYVAYLKTKGFVFEERETFGDGVSYYYWNDWTGVMIDMFQYTTEGILWIQVIKYF
jgi:hypothetical protein